MEKIGKGEYIMTISGENFLCSTHSLAYDEFCGECKLKKYTISKITRTIIRQNMEERGENISFLKEKDAN